MTITVEDVRAIATAIAAANHNPESDDQGSPEKFVEKVVAAFTAIHSETPQ
jgi:hypothetical protein